MKHVTINDVAKHARVGRATVDRVLNGRGTTKPETTQKVLNSAKILGYRVKQSKILNTNIEKSVPRAVRLNSFKLGFVLLSDKYSFYKSLSESLTKVARNYTTEAPKFVFFTLDQIELVATAIINLAKEVDIIGIVSIDHPLIRHAVEEVTRSGTKVITLLSDLSSCNQSAYIGWDNKKAGRTAGWAVQRFYPEQSKIGIVIGDNRFTCQETCEISFRSYLREISSNYQFIEPVRSYENIQDGYDATMSLLQDHPDLSLLYAPCGGVEGIAQALLDTGKSKTVTFICHGPIENQQIRFIDDTIDMMLTHHIDELSTNILTVSRNLIENEPSGFINTFVEFVIKTKENI